MAYSLSNICTKDYWNPTTIVEIIIVGSCGILLRHSTYLYKSSAVAEMGDRGHNRHGPKRWGLLCPFRAELKPSLIQCGLGRGLLPYQVAASSIQPFGHNKHGPKSGWWWACPLFLGSWVQIEHKVAWADAYLHTKWHLDASSRLATITRTHQEMR